MWTQSVTLGESWELRAVWLPTFWLALDYFTPANLTQPPLPTQESPGGNVPLPCIAVMAVQRSSLGSSPPFPFSLSFFVKMGVVFLSFRVCIPVTNPSLFISSTRRCKQSWQATRLSGSAEEILPGWGLFYTTGSARADWRLNLWMNKEKHCKTFGCWSDVVKVPPLNH